ncbi:MAG: hypothetical protein EBY28_15750 [Betaproteobacteria bacterium]|nr:hypothetical protein [Betaproteobacteria bacterium]
MTRRVAHDHRNDRTALRGDAAAALADKCCRAGDEHRIGPFSRGSGAAGAEPERFRSASVDRRIRSDDAVAGGEGRDDLRRQPVSPSATHSTTLRGRRLQRLVSPVEPGSFRSGNARASQVPEIAVKSSR